MAARSSPSPQRSPRGALRLVGVLLGLVARSPTTWLISALALALAGACSDAGAPETAAVLGRGVYIGAAWRSTRAVIGHQVHVLREKIACTSCHELMPDSIGAAPPFRCAGCHEREARIEHASAQAKERFGPSAWADCTTCHAFTEAGSEDAPVGAANYEARECNRCHMQRQGRTPGVKVHGDSECVKCHRPHEDPKPAPGACRDCHHDVTNTHGAQAPSETGSCTGCHRHQHAPAADARHTCAECHSTFRPMIPKTALFSDGHPECVGCHRPHAFGKAAALACRSCHEDVLVLGAPRVRQHDACTSCHAPHDVRGSPDQACAACHDDKHPDHPKRGGTSSCVGCHDPHPSRTRVHARARTCSSCHQAAASDKSFHGGADCKSCHKPHAFVRSAAERGTCEACHAREVAAAPRAAGSSGDTRSGHEKCDSCHGGLPHRPTTLAVGCGSCHAREHEQVNRGHEKCTSCHEPHGGAEVSACSSCHRAEQASAPRGHQDCKTCHQAHGGEATKATCASCHAAASKTKHGGMPQGCDTCHRVHGPQGISRPPACASCHPIASLPGLHRAGRHQDCGRCHTGHGEALPAAERAGCLACHEGRRNHYADAPSCASCHLFDKSR